MLEKHTTAGRLLSTRAGSAETWKEAHIWSLCSAGQRINVGKKYGDIFEAGVNRIELRYQHQTQLAVLRKTFVLACLPNMNTAVFFHHRLFLCWTNDWIEDACVFTSSAFPGALLWSFINCLLISPHWLLFPPTKLNYLMLRKRSNWMEGKHEVLVEQICFSSDDLIPSTHCDHNVLYLSHSQHNLAEGDTCHLSLHLAWELHATRKDRGEGAGYGLPPAGCSLPCNWEDEVS